MYRFRSSLLMVSLLGIASLAFAQQNPQTSPAPKPVAAVANPQFDKIKTLVGDWEAKVPEGKVVPVTFRLISAGSAVMMSSPDGDTEMITVIHPDGAQLMATHYCSAKNQPRFVSEPSGDPNVIRFKFKDVTNLASPSTGYMSGLTITFVDPNHHTESWTYTEAGKDQDFTIQATRKN